MSFLRFVLFCVFFAVGTAAIALSIQADEIQNLYKSKDILAKTLADNSADPLFTSDWYASAFAANASPMRSAFPVLAAQ